MTPRAFEWDDAKAASNLAKHSVPFDYATRVFLDEAVVDFDASRETDGEARRKAIGLIEERVFTVVYVQRGEAIRIISARRANATERKAYGQI
ncbi:MAG TPA: BrnT family toxin [Roseiarcus sp.]|nr:BrnT family toxin [Roseiarcus sp.]